MKLWTREECWPSCFPDLCDCQVRAMILKATSGIRRRRQHRGYVRCRVCAQLTRRDCLGLLCNGTSTELLCRDCMAWAVEVNDPGGGLRCGGLWEWAVWPPSWCAPEPRRS